MPVSYLRYECSKYDDKWWWYIFDPFRNVKILIILIIKHILQTNKCEL